MIVYIEKGIGLHDAIATAGHWLVEGAAGWSSSDDTAVQAIIDAYSLDQAKAAKIAEVDRLAKSKRDQVVADISPAEMAAWSIKRAEAQGYDGTDASAPTLVMEAQVRGVATAEIVAKVQTKAAQLGWLEAQISGVNGRHNDAIKALTDFPSVAAYDYATGWPV